MKNIETCVNILGISYGVAEYETTLGVIILTLNALLIVYNTFSKIYHRIKNKQYNKIVADLEEGIETLEKLKKEDD